MGYSKDGSITNYWPDDNLTEMYIEDSSRSLSELLVMAKAKWPNATLDNIKVSTDYIHTHCLGYDNYDPSDYTLFTILTYTGD
jgi:hypothetical protein